MAKTEKELEEIRKKAEELESELSELSDEELDRVAGGSVFGATGEPVLDLTGDAKARSIGDVLSTETKNQCNPQLIVQPYGLYAEDNDNCLW